MAATDTDASSANGRTHEQDAYHVLAVKAGGLLICIDLESVERTFSLVALQPVPGGALFVAGIMNHAGKSLPVIDLAIRLALPASSYNMDTPIVVCSHGGRQVGVIVNDILGILALNRRDIQLSRELECHGSAFRASLHTPQGLAFLLDSAWLADFDLYAARAQAKKEARAQKS